MDCSFEGCGRTAITKGLCSTHYQQKLKGEPLRPIKRYVSRDSPRTCRFDGCDRPRIGQGLCSAHYQQMRSGKQLHTTLPHGPNEIRVRDGYAEVILVNRHGVAIGCAEIDIDDVERVGRHRWRSSVGGHGGRAYCISHTVGSLHRFLMDCPDDLEVDHIDGNPMNNRRTNLRIVTRSENCQNQARSGRERLRGIHRRPDGTWMAAVTVNRKMHYTCGLRSEEEARAEAVRLRAVHFTHQNESRHENDG